MGEAFLWGVVGGSSLVIGGSIARRVSLTARHVGLIMAFGAGVLISAVAYELVHEAFETSAGDGGIALALLAGSALFFGAEVLIHPLRRDGQKAQGQRRRGGRSEESSPGSSRRSGSPWPSGSARFSSQHSDRV